MPPIIINISYKSTYQLIQTLTNGINLPVNIVVDAIGNLFVANIGTNTVEKFSPSGVLLQTLNTGDGGGYPNSLAVDQSGNLWVANLIGSNVQEFSSNGVLMQTLDLGVTFPSSIALDGSGNLWVANWGNNTIEEFSSGGQWLQTLDSGDGSSPWALAISNGNVFVANSGNDTVAEFSAGGALLQTLNDGISNPGGLAVDSSGNIFIANTGNNTVEKFSSSGVLLQTLATGDSSNPISVAVDQSGNVWVANEGNNTVLEFSASGTLLQTLDSGVLTPMSITVDSSGRVWVADYGNNTVQEFVASPLLAAATYSAATGLLTLTGNNLTTQAADYIIPDFSFKGDGGKVCQLAWGSSIVGTPTSTSVTIQLSSADQFAINGLFNKNGAAANDGSAYNVYAWAGWDAGAAANATSVTVTNAMSPTLSGLVYNSVTGVFSVTGSQLVNGVNLNNWSLLNGQFHFNNTDAVSWLSATGFAVTLSSSDRASLNALLLKGSATNLSTPAGWDGDSGVAITAQTVLVNPIVNAVTYNAANGQLTLSGNYLAAASIVMPNLSLTGDGGSVCGLSNSSTVLGTPTNTSLTIQLSAASQLAVDAALNKNGTLANDGTAYNFSASAGWGIGGWHPGAAYINTQAVSVINATTPTLSSVSYNASTGVFNFIGSQLSNGVHLSNLSLLNSHFTFNSTDSISQLTANGFSVSLSAPDRANINALLLNGPTTSLAAQAGWDGNSGTAITAQSVAVNPIIHSAAYNAATGQLTLTGQYLTAAGIQFPALTLNGDGGVGYALGYSSQVVGITTSSSLTIQLSVGAQLAIDGLLNKNGTAANDGTLYGLTNSVGWHTGATAIDNTPVTVSNAMTPTLSGIVYDASTGVFSVTGSQLVNGVNLNNWSLLNGQFHFNNTDAVSWLSATGFAVTLSNSDHTSLNTLLLGGTAAKLSVQAGWDGDSGAAVAALPVLVNPILNAVTYNAANGQLTLTGNYLAAASIVMPNLSLTGDGGSVCGLSNSSTVLGTPTNTSLTIQLSAASQLAVDAALNKNGTLANDGTAYNFSASAGWGIGGWHPGAAYINTQAVSVINATTPTLSSVSYNASTGVFNFIGSQLSNGIHLDHLSAANGQFIFNNTDSLSKLAATGFTVTLSATDQANINSLLLNEPVASVTAQAGWDSNSGDAITHGVAIQIIGVSHLTV